MTVAVRLMSFLDAKSAVYRIEPHGRAYTAQEVAELTHVRGKEMVKTIIVVADGTHVMLALPATAKVDLTMLKYMLGAGDVRLAGEREFGQDFPDCELGGMPPFGSLYGLRMIASDGLRGDDEIVFNAGNHTEVVHMKRADWENLAQPEWGRFTR